MSNHNYSQYSNNKKKKNYNKPKTEVEDFVTTVESPAEPAEIKMESAPVVEPVIVNEVADVQPKREVETNFIGIVSGCNKLNVRFKPAIDADVVTVLEVNSEIVVDTARSTTDWLKITTTAGVEGFCMRKFVTAKV